jgi:hypothetical protein
LMPLLCHHNWKKYQVDYLPLTQPILQFQNRNS